MVSALVGLGAIGPARRLADAISRGGIGADVDWLLAPLWKLPPAARRPLRSFWTRSRFFEALGSQIASMPESARETLDAARDGYGDLPLVTISMADPGEHRLRQQEALARLSSAAVTSSRRTAGTGFRSTNRSSLSQRSRSFTMKSS